MSERTQRKWRSFALPAVICLAIVFLGPRTTGAQENIDALLAESRAAIAAVGAEASGADVDAFARVLAAQRKLGDAIKADGNLARRADVIDVRSDLGAAWDRLRDRVDDAGFAAAKQKAEAGSGQLPMPGTKVGPAAPGAEIKATSSRGGEASTKAPKDFQAWTLDGFKQLKSYDRVADEGRFEIADGLTGKNSTTYELRLGEIEGGAFTDTLAAELVRWRLENNDAAAKWGDDRWVEQVAISVHRSGTIAEQYRQLGQRSRTARMERLISLDASKRGDIVAAYKEAQSSLRKRLLETRDFGKNPLTADEARALRQEDDRLCQEIVDLERIVVWMLGKPDDAEASRANRIFDEIGKLQTQKRNAQEDALKKLLRWKLLSYATDKTATGGQGEQLLAHRQYREHSAKALEAWNAAKTHTQELQIGMEKLLEEWWSSTIKRGLAAAPAGFLPKQFDDRDPFYREFLTEAEYDAFKAKGFFKSCTADTTLMELVPFEGEAATYARRRGQIHAVLGRNE